MYRFDIKEIKKEDALQMIQKYHYSNTLLKLNKHFIGFFLGNELVGVVTLGWGTRPRHTIQRMFPSLDTKDYLEIGRMCMKDEMPRNSESQMLSQLVKWMKVNLPEIEVLFTWADGMVGKVGYVYQAYSIFGNGFAITTLNGFDRLAILPLIVFEKELPVLFNKGFDDREFINLKFLILRQMGIVKSPLLKRNISANKI